jgi:hypothetical protein
MRFDAHASPVVTTLSHRHHTMSDDGQPMSSIFNEEDADFRLRSADGVIFRVHRLILTCASDVFKTMLSMPQPSQHAPQSVPTVNLTENGPVIELL